MHVTEKEMEDARLPLHLRDFCAHVLIPLNQCRRETFYLPWKCTAKRYAYIRCEMAECEFVLRNWVLAAGCTEYLCAV